MVLREYSLLDFFLDLFGVCLHAWNMCRWVAYIGPKLPLSHLITRPKNGIVQQAVDNVAYTPGLPTNNQRNHAVNADGFGISFYDSNNNPHTYKSTKPAWSDTNLSTLCNNIDSHLVLAHVRAASPGLAVQEVNCHPFSFQNLTFMHNGGVGGFKHMKRPLSEMFANEIWHSIQGSTDSEYCFGLFLTHLNLFGKNNNNLNNKTDFLAATSKEHCEEALRKTIESLINLQQKYGDSNDANEQSASMNFCVSNGSSIVASRMRRPVDDDSCSLFLGTGQNFNFSQEENRFRFGANEDGSAGNEQEQRVAIISSEPLTLVTEDWAVVPEETLLVVDERGEVKMSSLL